MYWSVSVESVQKIARSTGRSVSRIMVLYIRTPVTAALSSKRGNVTVLIGASFDLDMINLHAYPPTLK